MQVLPSEPASQALANVVEYRVLTPTNPLTQESSKGVLRLCDISKKQYAHDRLLKDYYITDK